MLVLPLHDKHNRKGFDCGDATLNSWLQQTARQHQQKGISATFVATANEGSTEIFGFYAIFLKEVKCGDLLYGRQHYDYQEGTLVCLAPGQVIGIEDNGEVYQPKGWALVFHPDLIRGTSLGRNIRE